ncbi:NAD(P)-binding protein [Lophium mytilinum]|uniref:NAD(P)-binding protein n=1 Tax=Lophium mytilinum TaxID=390894 RepID=A0A6A6QU61_9PEZI|nr:NAD(P)-binding protein [Lophium mytilinum]
MTSTPKVALITGSNGITGAAMVNQLLSSPSWTRIIAVYRTTPTNIPQDPRLSIALVDLSQPASEIATSLTAQNATGVTHFFHFAYKHHSDPQALVDSNVPMFANTLTAIDDTSRSTLQRVILQTGGKTYGVYFRAALIEPTPEHPIHPRVSEPAALPLFYYGQEDFMLALAAKRSWKWNVTVPFWINGFTKGNGMSYATTVAIYFTLQKAAGRPAVFAASATDASVSKYMKPQHMSSARHIARFTEWVADNESVGNEWFNIVDDTKTTFADVWESTGRYFGVPVANEPGFDLIADVERRLAAGEWDNVVEKYGGSKEALKYATWETLAWAQAGNWGADVSMDKAIKAGWTETVDTNVELARIFDEMKEAGVIPDIK